MRRFEKKKFKNLNYKIVTIDNFLDKKDYDNLRNFCSQNFVLNNNKESIGDKNFNVFPNEINNQGIIKSTIDPNLLKRLHRNYHSISMSILKDLCPAKAELYDYSNFSIVVTSKNSKFPIHDDIPNKLLSGVIYIHPEKNVSTTFYSNKRGSNKMTIGWKINRGVFFSRKERETWHSYKGDGINDRIALVYNLMTNRTVEAVKAEGKNIFLSKLRYKINPYLYKYFSITI